MSEIERLTFDDQNELHAALADEMRRAIANGREKRGSALLALSGGSSPFPIYRSLAEEDLGWAEVTIIPVDERLVPENDKLSNTAKLREVFEPAGARVLGLFPDPETDPLPPSALDVVDLPADLLWLGMGGDGHFASVFPGPDYERAFATENDTVFVNPFPMPAEAPVGRLSISPRAIAASRRLILVIAGRDKRAVFDRALAEGTASPYPMGRFLEELQPTMTVYEGLF